MKIKILEMKTGKLLRFVMAVTIIILFLSINNEKSFCFNIMMQI